MIQYKLKINNIVGNQCNIDDAIHFSATKKVEERTWLIQRPDFCGQFYEYRNHFFDIMNHKIRYDYDCCLETIHSGTSFLAFETILKGNVKRIRNGQAKEWLKGDSNIVLASDYNNENNFFRKGDVFEMFSFVVSPIFLLDLVNKYPDVFEPYYLKMKQENLFFMSENNIQLTSTLQKTIHEIMHSKLMGNYSDIYVESKILECITSFLVLSVNNNKKDDNIKYSLAIRDKMYHAKNILDTEFVSPPTLHNLALQVGTNECTLKSAFKYFFNQTVFSYIYDLRMSLAIKYLLETNKTISEIANLIGYEYQSHFCTAFKRKYSVSPLEYRNQIKNC